MQYDENLSGPGFRSCQLLMISVKKLTNGSVGNMDDKELEVEL